MSEGPKLMRLGRTEGADEERVGAFLDRELADVAIVLHDLRVPGSRANIDHVVIAPSGVWVVDSKWRGELPLDLDGTDDSASVDAMAHQVCVVASAVGGRERELPIRAALCFGSARWGRAPRPFWIDGVLVTYPGDLVDRIRQDGPLDDDTVGWIAARLALDLESERPNSPPPPA